MARQATLVVLGVVVSALIACAHTQPVPLQSDPPDLAVGFVSSLGMNHTELGLVMWRGGRRDDTHVLRAGRYVGPCTDATYETVLHHPPQSPVVLGVGCDPVAVEEHPVVQVVEAVREPTEVVVYTASASQPTVRQPVVRASVPSGVAVTPATPAQVRAAQQEITSW